MNRLLAVLEKSGPVSIDSLRALYRRLAVKCHPDAARDSGEEFVRLQGEYEDALRCLLLQEATPRSSGVGPRDARTEFLRRFYFFSIVYPGRGWEDLATELVGHARAYRGEVGALFASHAEVFLRPASEGKHQTFLIQTHQMLLDSVKQLAWCFESNLVQNERLLMGYLDELARRARDLATPCAMVLRGMCDLLRQEARGTPVSLMTIGTMGTKAARH